MKLGIILQTNKPEQAWNGLRLAITVLKTGNVVKIFLLSEGVEIANMADIQNFDVAGKLKEFIDLKGELMACGTCLKSRHQEGSSVCPISNMQDLMRLVEESDKILTF